MADMREEAERFLSETPGGESALREILDVDDGVVEWTFDDVDVDTGTFGEIVSRGFVERTDRGYAVAKPAPLEEVLADETPKSDAGDVSRPAVPAAITVDPGEIDRLEIGVLALAIGILVFLRVLAAPAVFRGEDVVLLGNDPYSYRYWLDRLAADYGSWRPLATGDLPTHVLTDDVTLFLALWAAVSLLPWSVGPVLAAYPVAVAAVTGVVVYWLTRSLTADRRVAIAAVAMLAVTPVHAYRTAVGFADHHAFDYLWLGVTVLALVVLRSLADERDGPDRPPVGRLRSRRGWLYAGLLGVGVTMQTFSWRGAPILVAPLALYGLVLTVVDAKNGRSPTVANRYFLCGLAIAAALCTVLYVGLGWATDHRALLPGAILSVVLLDFATGEITLRTAARPRVTVLASLGTASLGAAVIWTTTSVFTRLVTRAESWVFGAVGRDTAGTASLFGTQQGTFFGPVLTFGFVLFVALAVAVPVTTSALRGKRSSWLPVVVYFWYLLAWTTVFIRFGGSLAVAAAPLAGYGFVSLAAKMQVARSPSDRGGSPDSGPEFGSGGRESATPPDLELPSRGTVRDVVILFFIVSSFSLVQIPVTQSQLAVDDEAYRTARWIAADADSAGLTYPDNYVLTRWSKNRVFNYFVSGESASYLYAEDTFASFAGSEEPDQWYDRLRDRVGYVVLDGSRTNLPDAPTHGQLYGHYGNPTAGRSGVEHYRAVYASETGRFRVFELVPGSVLTGTAPPNRTITVETTVDLGHDSFTYRRTVETTTNGRFAVRVPHSGTYAGGSDPVSVTQADVRAGGFAVDGDGVAHWNFDAGRGSVAFDRTGGNHGFVNGSAWTSGYRGRALDFDGHSFVTVPSPPRITGDTGFTVSARFRTDPLVDYRADGDHRPIVTRAPESGAGLLSEGFYLGIRLGRIVGTIGDGSGERSHVVGPRVDDGDWHSARITWDGDHLRLYLDGHLVERKPYTYARRPPEHSLYIGGPPGYRNFQGVIDEVHVVNRTVAPEGGEFTDSGDPSG